VAPKRTGLTLQQMEDNATPCIYEGGRRLSHSATYSLFCLLSASLGGSALCRRTRYGERLLDRLPDKLRAVNDTKFINASAIYQ
jgi:hypothetical protein